MRPPPSPIKRMHKRWGEVKFFMFVTGYPQQQPVMKPWLATFILLLVRLVGLLHVPKFYKNRWKIENFREKCFKRNYVIFCQNLKVLDNFCKFSDVAVNHREFSLINEKNSEILMRIVWSLIVINPKYCDAKCTKKKCSWKFRKIIQFLLIVLLMIVNHRMFSWISKKYSEIWWKWFFKYLFYFSMKFKDTW